jgi:hypothetical protein
MQHRLDALDQGPWFRRRHEGYAATVGDVIFQNVAFLNSVSLKALSNELFLFIF